MCMYVCMYVQYIQLTRNYYNKYLVKIFTSQEGRRRRELAGKEEIGKVYNFILLLVYPKGVYTYL